MSFGTGRCPDIINDQSRSSTFGGLSSKLLKSISTLYKLPSHNGMTPVRVTGLRCSCHYLGKYQFHWQTDTSRGGTFVVLLAYCPLHRQDNLHFLLFASSRTLIVWQMMTTRKRCYRSKIIHRRKPMAPADFPWIFWN